VGLCVSIFDRAGRGRRRCVYAPFTPVGLHCRVRGRGLPAGDIRHNTSPSAWVPFLRPLTADDCFAPLSLFFRFSPKNVSTRDESKWSTGADFGRRGSFHKDRAAKCTDSDPRGSFHADIRPTRLHIAKSVRISADDAPYGIMCTIFDRRGSFHADIRPTRLRLEESVQLRISRRQRRRERRETMAKLTASNNRRSKRGRRNDAAGILLWRSNAPVKRRRPRELATTTERRPREAKTQQKHRPVAALDGVVVGRKRYDSIDEKRSTRRR